MDQSYELQNLNPFGQYLRFLHGTDEENKEEGSVWKQRKVVNLEWKQLFQWCRKIMIDDVDMIVGQIEAQSQFLIDCASVCAYMSDSIDFLGQGRSEFTGKECEKFSLKILDFILRLPLDKDEKCMYDRKLIEIENSQKTLFEKIDSYRMLLSDASTPFRPSLSNYIVEDWIGPNDH